MNCDGETATRTGQAVPRVAEPSVKILVAYHKPYTLLASEVFVPIHVGRAAALHPAKDGVCNDADVSWLAERMIGDDTGDSISSRNRNYSELTGIYWAWKNYEELGNPEYIGFMQYRRHLIFNEELFDGYLPRNDDERVYAKINVGSVSDGYIERFGLTDSEVIKTCSSFDCIVPKPCELSHLGIDSIRKDYALIEGTRSKDLRLLEKTLRRCAPEYSATLSERLLSSDKRCYQSFVMKKETFFAYCEFLFGVLAEVDKQLDTSDYSLNGQRTLGYLGEILFDCYIYKLIQDGGARVKELGTTYLCAETNPQPICPKTAIVLLAYSDFESLELTLAAIGKTLKGNTKLFILQNGRENYDCERTLRVAQRYEALFPRHIKVVTDIKPQRPYWAIRELLNSDRLKDYDYICKVDDDAFPVTDDWFEQLCALYDRAYARYGMNLSYVTPLINNNPFGFKKLLEYNEDLREEYFSGLAREHAVGSKGSRVPTYLPWRIISKDEVSDDGCGTIWQYAYIARWIHERTSLRPDAYREAVTGLPDVILENKRYSINCIIFKKGFWNEICDTRSEFPDDDEYLCENYGRKSGRFAVAGLSIPFVHLFFHNQREENRDLISRFQAVYENWLGYPFPIALQSNKALENENRLRYMEEKKRAASRTRAIGASRPKASWDSSPIVQKTWKIMPYWLKRIAKKLLKRP